MTNCTFSFDKGTTEPKLNFSYSTIQNCLFTIPTIKSGQGISFINPTGLDTNPLIFSEPIGELCFDYCFIEKLRLANIKTFRLSAQYSIIKDSEFLNAKVLRKLTIDNFMLDNLRVEEEFFEEYYKNAKAKDKTNKENQKQLHKDLLVIKDNFNQINFKDSRKKYYLIN
jgi:hypothetical protein